MSSNPVLDPALFADKATLAAALLRAMSNEHRLMILCRLGAGDMAVAEIGKGMPLSQSALSQHLAILRDQKLVSTQRQGLQVRYRIANSVVLQLIGVLGRHFCPELFE